MLSLLAKRSLQRGSISAFATGRQVLGAAVLEFASRRMLSMSASTALPSKVTATASKSKTPRAAVKTPRAATEKTKPKKAAGTTKTKPAARATKPKAAPKKKVAPKKAAPTKMVIKAEDKPPKAPLTAFMLFSQRFRSGIEIKSLNDAQDTARKAGAAWQALSEEEKEVFNKEAAEIRADYQKRRDQWWASADPALVRELNKRRVKAGRNRLRSYRVTENKRPITGFIRFYVEQQAKAGGDGKSIRTRSKDAAVLWKELSDAQKKPYLDAAQTARDEYQAKKLAGLSAEA